MEGRGPEAIIVGFYQAYSVAIANGLIPAGPAFIDNIFNAIPLSQYGLTWLVPCLVGGVVGAIIWKALGKESIVDEIDKIIAEENAESVSA
ncbi:MAG: branched-chain amino acid transport system II carrier protein [Emergencia timonensis]